MDKHIEGIELKLTEEDMDDINEMNDLPFFKKEDETMEESPIQEIEIINPIREVTNNIKEKETTNSKNNQISVEQINADNKTINLQKVRQLQQKTPWMKMLIHKDRNEIQEESNKENNIEKEVINKHGRAFEVRDGLLFYIKDKEPRLVIPEEYRDQIIMNAHKKNHAGTDKIYKTLNKMYYWPEFFDTIRNTIQNCMDCQQATKDYDKELGLVKENVSIKNKGILDIWGIDIVGPLNKTKEEYEYILVMVDLVSKYAETEAMKTINTEEFIEKFINRLIYKYGLPRTIITDNAGTFTSSLAQIIYKTFKVEHNRTSPYHPIANGGVERFNRTLGEGLRKLVNNNNTNWNEYLQSFTYAYNNLPHDTTKMIPYEMIYTKKSNMLLIDGLEDMNNDGIKQTYREIINKRKELMSKSIFIAQENIERKMKQNRTRINKDRIVQHFKSGEKAWVYNPLLGRKRQNNVIKKFKREWEQVIIEERINENHYKIKYQNNKRKVVHRNILKKLYSKVQPRFNINHKGMSIGEGIKEIIKCRYIIQVRTSQLYHQYFKDIMRVYGKEDCEENKRNCYWKINYLNKTAIIPIKEQYQMLSKVFVNLKEQEMKKTTNNQYNNQQLKIICEFLKNQTKNRNQLAEICNLERNNNKQGEIYGKIKINMNNQNNILTKRGEGIIGINKKKAKNKKLIFIQKEYKVTYKDNTTKSNWINEKYINPSKFNILHDRIHCIGGLDIFDFGECNPEWILLNSNIKPFGDIALTEENK